MAGMTDNLEYVAALVHGRRARMAEGFRLKSLSQARTLAELSQQTEGVADLDHSTLQRQWSEQLASETAELASHLSGVGADLIEWLVVRFQLENFKILVRRLMTDGRFEDVTAHLAHLPARLQRAVEAVSKAQSIQALARRMPRGAFRHELLRAADFYHEQPRSFLFEAVLDRTYFGELLAKAGALPGNESAWAVPVVVQEIDTFHFLLVMRGRFLYDLEWEALRPLHLPGTKISPTRFERMLASADLRALIAAASGVVLDAGEESVRKREDALGEADPANVERLAWSRFWRLANWAFHSSHMGVATVLAYLELRRIEVANLTTLSEGIRLGIPRESLYARLIPVSRLEAVHV